MFASFRVLTEFTVPQKRIVVKRNFSPPKEKCEQVAYDKKRTAPSFGEVPPKTWDICPVG